MSYSTRNNLPSEGKSSSVAVLNARLAETIDLALITKQAHWNIKGPQFIALHEMFDAFRAQLDVHVDEMAERVVQLGGTALGTSQAVGAASRLSPYPTNIASAPDHLSALLDRYGSVADSVRAAIDTTAGAGDADTADLLTAFSRALDKSVWFIEAHLHERQ